MTGLKGLSDRKFTSSVLIMSTFMTAVMVVSVTFGIEMNGSWLAFMILTGLTVSVLFAGQVKEKYFTQMATVSAGTQCGFMLQSMLANLTNVDHFHGLLLCTLACTIGYYVASLKVGFKSTAISVSFVAAFCVV